MKLSSTIKERYIEVTNINEEYKTKYYYTKGIGLVKTDIPGFTSELIEINYNKELINN